MRRQVVAALCFGVVFAIGNANTILAEITTYQSESTFRSAATIERTTTFDEFAAWPGTILGVGTASVDGITYSATDPSAKWAAIDLHVLDPPSAPNVLGTADTIPTAWTFSFGPGSRADAIGFYMVTQARPNAWIMTVQTATGQILTSPISLEFATYFGFTSPDGIVSVTIADYPGDNRMTNVWFDNVSRSVIVPEPSALVLFAIGAASLFAYAWRRRRQAA